MDYCHPVSTNLTDCYERLGAHNPALLAKYNTHSLAVKHTEQQQSVT